MGNGSPNVPSNHFEISLQKAKNVRDIVGRCSNVKNITGMLSWAVH